MNAIITRPVTALVIALTATGPAFAQLPKGEQAFTPPVRKFDVWSIAFSKDGKIVAASGGMWGDPGEIGVWEFATRKPLARFAEDLGVASVALTPDGKLLASGSWSGFVRVRDWAAGREVAKFDVPGVARVAFSPDGQLLATATEKNHTVQLWDIPRRKLLADLGGLAEINNDKFRFHCVLFSPDGKRVLAGGGDWKPGGTNQAVIWDVATKKQVLELIGHDDAIICMVFSPDAKTIATGGVDRTIRLWDADSGTYLKTMTGHRHWVESLAYTAAGKTLVSSSHDGTIRFWDVEQGVETDSVESKAGSVRVIHFTPDHAALLAGGAQKTLKIFDPTGHKELGILWSRLEPEQAAMEKLPLTKPLPEARGGGVDGGAVPETRWKLWLALGIMSVVVAAIIAGLWMQRRRSQPAPAATGAQAPHGRR